MLVTINSVGNAICIWCCQRTDDSVEATFKDGFKGTLCKKHFWDALKARSEQKPDEQRLVVKGNPNQ